MWARRVTCRPSRFRDSRWMGAPICLRWSDPVRDARRHPRVRRGSTLDALHATLHDPPPALGGSRTIESVIGSCSARWPKGPKTVRHQHRWSPKISGPVWCSATSSGSPRADDDAADRAAIPGIARGCRDRFPRVQPSRRDRQFAGGPRSLGVRSTAGAARSPPARSTSRASPPRCMSISDDRHAAARRRGDSRDDAAGRRAGGRGAVVACGSCHAARRVSATGRPRPAHRRFTLAAADAREQQLLKRDVPASPTAYEFHLRANQMLQQAWLASLEPAAAGARPYLRASRRIRITRRPG